jgi:transcription initiation factor TFIID TATA-box-binding protein
MQVVSTMGTGTLGREIDLEALVTELKDQLDDVDANFQSSSMVTIRLEKNGPAYTVYRTGSFQIRGAESEDSLQDALERFRELLNDIGVGSPGFEFELSTLVCMEDLRRELALETLAISLGLNSVEYEPEQFPGLVFRPEGDQPTLLLFASEKVIIGGAQTRNQAKAAVDCLKGELTELDIPGS